MRPDLLALSPDDLATLANRGSVREAAAELDSGRVTGELSEDGPVVVAWSDGVRTELPEGAHLRAGKCSCHKQATCKHLVRLVLLYQRSRQAPAPAAGPWGPESIGDEELARHAPARTLARARELFDAGVLAELVRGVQPVARFHVPGCTVRFLVRGDPRYARCDCADAAPCLHVALAVWAFRLLPADRQAGIVTAGSAAPPDTSPLAEADGALVELAEQGLCGLSKPARARLGRLEKSLAGAGLYWPAELVGELLEGLQAYESHDSRFAPDELAAVVGELALRADALRRPSELPALLISGTAGDRPADVEKGAYTGLGCGVEVGRRGVTMVAYLHEARSGSVSVLRRHIADTEKPFASLGARSAITGVPYATWAALGLGVLQVAACRRTARHELAPGRKGVTLTPRGRLAWEEVGPPVGFASFGALEERLAALPPSCLRPRRLADDFHVLRVARVADCRFDTLSHQVQAVLEDGAGRQALLAHPYTARGKGGCEALLARLKAGGEFFVSGRVRRVASGLLVQPVCLVWEERGKHSALQPWVERGSGGVEGAPVGEARLDAGPARERLGELTLAVGELLVGGLGRADAGVARAWRGAQREAESVGFARLAGKVAELADELEKKAHTLHWDAKPAAGRLLELAVLLRLARDVG